MVLMTRLMASLVFDRLSIAAFCLELMIAGPKFCWNPEL